MLRGRAGDVPALLARALAAARVALTAAFATVSDRWTPARCSPGPAAATSSCCRYTPVHPATG